MFNILKNILKKIFEILKDKNTPFYGKFNTIADVLLLIFGLALCTRDWIITLINNTKDTIKTITLNRDINTPTDSVDTTLVFVIVFLFIAACTGYVLYQERAKIHTIK